MNLIDVFFELGRELTKEIRTQLILNNKKATGKLIKSIDYRIIVNESQRLVRSLEIAIVAEDYLKYVNDGRRKGAKMPPPNKLDKWIVAKGIAPRDKKGKLLPRKSLQFLIARGIQKNGIKPTNIINNSIEAVFKKNQKKLEAAAVESLKEFVNRVFQQK